MLKDPEFTPRTSKESRKNVEAKVTVLAAREHIVT